MLFSFGIDHTGLPDSEIFKHIKSLISSTFANLVREFVSRDGKNDTRGLYDGDPTSSRIIWLRFTDP